MTMDDPYLVLGVARSCDGETLKNAYRRLVRENHPDVVADKGAATLRMTQINAAWALIGDPQKRADFDLRQRFEERQRRERFAVTGARPSNAPSRTPSTQPNSTLHSKTAPQGDKRAPATSSRHARLAEASRLLFKQNQPAEALELCRAILKTDFRNIPARELMGEAYLRLGQTERALAVWEQALVLAPNNVQLRRRWMQLMSPDVRAEPTAKAQTAPAPASSLPVKVMATRSKKKAPGLLSRLVERLMKR